MSNPWRVLGIPKGSDRAAIRRGYAVKLRTTNPEDNPEGFKKLREAYEWALQMADYQWQEDEFLAADEPVEAEQDEPPNGDREPPPPTVPVDPDAEQLAGLVEELDAQLASAWRNDARAQNLFAEILRHPGMDQLDGRTQVEFRIGTLIAQHVPASDAFLLDAVKAFEWNRVGRAEQWPFSAALDRYEEWKLIAAFERPDHRFHQAWRALTRPPGGRLPRKLLGFTHHARRIAELVDIIDYQSPGLLPSTLPAEVAWWRDRVARGTGSIADYLWALVIGLLGFGLSILRGLSPTMATGIALAAAAVVALDRYGVDGGYRRVAIWWSARPVNRRGGWLSRTLGWPVLMAILPFLVLALPSAPWAAAMVVLLCATSLLGLRISGNGQATPFDHLWGAALLSVIVFALAAGGQLAPPLSRLVMLGAAIGLLTQPLIAARPALLELADERFRNHGAFLFLLYAAALCAAAWWLSANGLVEPVVAGAMAVIVLWVLSPLIAASHLLLASIAARIVRGLVLIACFLLLGLANPLLVSPGMSNGEAIVALHLGAGGDPPLPQAAAALAEMRQRNPDLYRQIQRALPSQPYDNEKIDQAALAIDGMIDQAVPALVPVTSAALAGRYQRAKIDILYAVRKTDAAKCADGLLTVSPDLDDQARQEITSALLAIAAHGRAVAPGSRTASLPRKSDFDAAVDTLWPTVDATKIQAGVSNDIQDRCTQRIATAQAMANLPDEAIAAMLSLPAPKAAPKR